MHDIAHYLRPGHLPSWRNDPRRPRGLGQRPLRGARPAEERQHRRRRRAAVCQDTGTAIVMGKKGELVLTGGGDEEAIARGIYDTYQTSNLRYSQMAPLTHVGGEEHRHQPPRPDRDLRDDGDAYSFLFMAKGGGSANKSYLFQETKALLNPTA
jgi:fumarate hydratase, class I